MRAAEMAAMSGADVTLFDAMPSVGRKFLVAGKGGLNLTNAATTDEFAKRYSGPGQPDGLWCSLLGQFGAVDLRRWAAELGCDTFVSSSGRIYPEALKAAPLLRAWVRRLKDLGVEFAMRHRWSKLVPGPPHRLEFNVPNGATASRAFEAVILALGGASWPSTGSDGTWTAILREQNGVPIHPMMAANSGWEVDWPREWLEEVAGMPLKNVIVSFGDHKVAGELMLTRYGLEGGPIYELGPRLRAAQMPVIAVDLKPTFTKERLVRKMESARRDFLKEARVRWKLSDAACSILEHLPELTRTVELLASTVKSFQIPLTKPRPVTEAISSAGGVGWSAIDSNLMLENLPGVFVAGEMIDWEAPTGGFLLQGCFATGTRAGLSAVSWLGKL